VTAVAEHPLSAAAGTTPMVEALQSFWLWLHKGHYKIKNKAGRIVPLIPNRAQVFVFEKMLGQALAGAPIRIILPKARKEGMTTFFLALAFFFAEFHQNFQSRFVAHERSQALDMFGIVKRMVRHRRIDAEAGEAPPFPAKLPAEEKRSIQFEHDSGIMTLWAGGHWPGSGSTINLLHLSEVPKWYGVGDVSVAETLLSLLNSVAANEPFTIIVMEATASASDKSHQFEERYHQAVKGESGFSPVFIPWFIDEGYRSRGQPVAIETLNAHERWMHGELGVDLEQIAWYRQTKKDVCAGSDSWMKQENPCTAQEAFEVSVGKVYPNLDERRHARSFEVDGGWELYRAIDFGGANPFVCLWIAYRPGPMPAFSIDMAECHETWREMTHYRRDEQGKVKKEDDHTCDCIRYCCVTFNLLGGHVHVYRELYWPQHAFHGKGEGDAALEIKRMGGEERYVGSVADRSRPTSIQLFCQHGVPCSGQTRPKVIERGEVEDGIAVVNSLMLATVPMVYPAAKKSLVQMIREARAESPFPSVLADSELLLKYREFEESEASEGLYHPWFGGAN
jgi:hypothetical protein